MCVNFAVHTFFILFGGVFPIKNNNKDLPVNEGIKLPAQTVLRVLGPESELIGMLPLEKAQGIAIERDLDLVLIAPQAQPPVCRVMDYGKYRFERDKRDKEAKKKQQVVEIKEIQLSCRIDTNDFNMKAKRAIGFLQKNNKVKVIVRFKGRQMTHQDIGRELLAKFEEACAEFGAPDKKPVMEGRLLMSMLTPLKVAPVKKDAGEPDGNPVAE